MSAVASVRTSGVLPTGIRRLVAAATSILSTPTAQLLMTRSLGAAVHDGAVHGVSEQRQQAVHFVHVTKQLGRQRWYVVPPHVGLAGVFDEVQAALWQGARHEHLRARHAHSILQACWRTAF